MDWYLRSDFWELTYPLMFPSTRIEKAEDEVTSVLRLAGVHEGSVLDLCCGPGRFSIPLARMGFSVTAVDSTEFLMDIARNRASIEGLDVDWVHSDMRDFIRPSAYDLVINMFTSFGYFQDHCENMKVLKNARTSLRPGGRMVIETMGKEVLASIFRTVTCDETDEGHMLVQRHSINSDWSRIENDWILLEDDRLLGRWKFSHWIYSGVELRNMLLGSGFSEVEIYGDLEGSPYDSDAGRLVALATAGADT
jgi:SAM-dependent methyltransferase